jgi:hypothetical protein
MKAGKLVFSVSTVVFAVIVVAVVVLALLA